VPSTQRKLPLPLPVLRAPKANKSRPRRLLENPFLINRKLQLHQSTRKTGQNCKPRFLPPLPGSLVPKKPKNLFQPRQAPGQSSFELRPTGVTVPSDNRRFIGENRGRGQCRKLKSKKLDLSSKTSIARRCRLVPSASGGRP
jgi:hypothetical protein